MSVTLNSPIDYITGIGISTWGLTLINDELFVNDSATSIKVYDINTKALKRTLTTAISTKALGTDGTNLLIKNTSNQIVTINKTTGATISTKTNTTFTIGNSASFKVDLVNDRIYFCDYSTNLYIKKYSDGTLLASYSIPPTGYTSGVEIIDNKYILVNVYTSKTLYIAKIDNNDVSNLTFSLLYTFSGNTVGLIYYSGKMYFSTYSLQKIQSADILGMLLKYLIKQNSNYYTIKSTNYDSTTTHNFTPLTLAGGTTPSKSDIDTFGFDDLSVLTNSMTVGSDTFIPVLKFDNTAELKMYKG